MRIRYGCEISFQVAAPTPAFCLVDLNPDRRADIVLEEPLTVTPTTELGTSYDVHGNLLRRFIAAPGETTLRLAGVVHDSGEPDSRNHAAMALPVVQVPPEALLYLNGSRYCETDKLSAIAWNTFGHMAAGTAMVEAICDFVNGHLRFDYQQARSTRTAMEAYYERVGVCRDFAHLAITLCRCMNIPARYVNGYLGDIGVPADPAPMDFNAWFEVHLGGSWYTFDARHNQRRIGRLPIARGRDASDVPMLQTFGPHILTKFQVVTEEVAVAPKIFRATLDRPDIQGWHVR